MSSSAIERPIVGSHPVIQYSNPWKTNWQVEAWRASRQYLPILMFSLFGALVVQVTLCLMTNIATSVQDARTSHAAMYQAAAYGPLAFGIGVICTACGLDRESMAWNWKSTLPVSWRHDLVVVVVSLLVGSLICAVFNCLFACLLDFMWLDRPLDESQRTWIWDQFLSAAFISFPTLAILAAGLLWFDNIGLGIAAGTTFAFLLHGLCLLIVEVLGQSQDALMLTTWWVGANVVLAVGSIALGAYTHRWRRMSGQYWQWTPAQSVSERTLTFGKQPTFAKTQQWQTFINIRYYLAGLGLMTLAQVVAILFFGSEVRHLSAAEPLSIILCGLIGLECFGSDRSNASIRFLSDRGVWPTKIWFYRLHTSLSLMLIPILISLFVNTWVQSAELVAYRFFWKLSAFFVLMLCRLCFQSWLAAVAVGILTLVFNAEVMNLQKLAAGIYGEIAEVIVLAAFSTYFSYRVWHALTREQEAKTLRYFVLFVLAFTSVNLLIFPMLRAYSLPNPSISLGQLRADAEQAPIISNFDNKGYFQFDNGPIITAYFSAIYSQTAFPSGELQPIYANPKLRTEELEGERLSQLESDIRELSPTFFFLEDKIRNDSSTTPTLVSPDLVGWLAQFFVVAASAKKDQLAIHVAEVLNLYLARNQDRMLIWGPHTNTPEVTMDQLPDVDWMRLLQQKPAEAIMPLEISGSQLQAISARVHLAMIRELNSGNEAIQVLTVSKYNLPHNLLLNFNTSELGPNGIFSVLAQTYENHVLQHAGVLPWEKYRKQQEILNSYQAFQNVLQPVEPTQYATDHHARDLILVGPRQIIPYTRRWQRKQLALHMSILEGHVRAANEQKGSGSEPNTTASENSTTKDDRETSAEPTAADKGQDQ